jgi:general secretion pathway protein J
MSDRRGGQAAEHGFTLLELLAAITLLGLLMAVLFGGLRLGARVWETADARLDASTRIQIVQDFVRQRLAETLPLEALALEAAQGSDFAPLFQGTTQAVRFAGLMPANLGAGLYLMDLVLLASGEADGSGNLVLRWRPFDLYDQTVAEVEPEERVLVENIEGLELAYFGTNNPEQPPEWREGWERQPELPRLIRIRVHFAEDDERQWPELIVRPMLDRAPTFGF